MAKKATAKKKAGKVTKKKTTKRGGKPKGLTEEQMMAMWEKAATPGEPHRRLDAMAGTFAAKTTLTMSPGAPAQVSEGTSQHRLALGGRYLEQHYSGNINGMPFEGIGYTGYDNTQKRYFGTWMDSFGTAILHTVGVGRPSPTAMDFEATSIQPTGEKQKFLCKVRIKDHDQHTYEMWTNGPKGKSYRTMLIEYKRK